MESNFCYVKRIGGRWEAVKGLALHSRHPDGHKRNFQSVMYTTGLQGYAGMQLVAQVT